MVGFGSMGPGQPIDVTAMVHDELGPPPQQRRLSAAGRGPYRHGTHRLREEISGDIQAWPVNEVQPYKGELIPTDSGIRRTRILHLCPQRFARPGPGDDNRGSFRLAEGLWWR
jgi:hypothetical protein